MLVIGLTGGIGSGKSTVAQIFAELGAEIIDTDQLAREVVAPGKVGLKKIEIYFGSDILDEKKQLDRGKLRKIVFQDSQKRLWLEQLLHPLIREKLRERVHTSHAPYCVAVIPLLVETAPNELLDRVLVVDASEENQVLRAKQRDKLTDKQVMAIMKTQVSRQKRLAAADDIIYNDQDLEYLKQQVLKLHQKYIKLAAKTTQEKKK